MNRRNFMQKSALATAGTLLAPSFLQAFAQPTRNANDKILVVLQLSGGNDGLNTVVPFENDLYYNARPRLAVAKDKALRLTDELGLNPAMAPLQRLYKEGLLTVLNGVGYPNPNRSHFRSMDIWHTASGAQEHLSTGWLGRYMDAACQGSAGSYTPHHVIEVDDTLSLALKGRQGKGLAMRDPARLQRLLTRGPMGRLAQAHEEQLAAYQAQHSQLHYLYKTMVETSNSADYLLEHARTPRNTAQYPKHKFAQGLKTISTLIQAGVDTRVYYTSLGGFDTHVRQATQQQRLLEIYAETLEAFVHDLKANGLLNNVLILTFSEFGRRVAQNASNGTDHGKANVVFVAGSQLHKPGIYNPLPSLADLDGGDLRHSIDFRQIYATLLDRWLGTPSKAILGQAFEPLHFLA